MMRDYIIRCRNLKPTNQFSFDTESKRKKIEDKANCEKYLKVPQEFLTMKLGVFLFSALVCLFSPTGNLKIDIIAEYL